MTFDISSPEDLRDALGRHDYLADLGLATSLYLSIAMARPLLLEGEAGTGKTEIAHTLAEMMSAPLIRLQCYDGIDVSQAVYAWDYPRQLLALRGHSDTTGELGVDEVYSESYLLRRPLLKAISATAESGPVPVLLIDEIDRADDEFEAYLLEILSGYSVTIPEIGTFTATRPPVVIVTSNRTRDLHDALKRRCLYHWVEHPDLSREIEIVRRKVPEATDALAREVARASGALRDRGLFKPPGIAETIDWARALTVLGASHLDEAAIERTLGTVVKYREDRARLMSDGGIAALVVRATSDAP